MLTYGNVFKNIFDGNLSDGDNFTNPLIID